MGFISGWFLIIFLLSPIALVVFLVKPNWLTLNSSTQLSRKKILALFTGVFISSFVGFGVTAEPIEKASQPEIAGAATSEVVEESPLPSPLASESPSPSPSPSPTSEPSPISSPSLTPSPLPSPSPTPIPTPTTKPTPVAIASPVVKSFYQAPATQEKVTTSPTGFQCSCSKTCEAMASCEEAYYQLNSCGCSKRDGDNDGVPCESICPGG